jgi:integrase
MNDNVVNIKQPIKYAARGTVTIENKQGKWRLRLPRSVAQDSARYISTRLDATESNFKKVQRVAWQIEEDITTATLDITLECYQAEFKPQLTVVTVTPIKSLDLRELWSKYCEYKKPLVSPTTYIKEFQRKYTHHVESLPTKNLNESVAIRDYVVANLSANSAKKFFTQLSACCKWGNKSGLISLNPFSKMATDIKVNKQDVDKIDPFSKTEREAIEQAFLEHKTFNCYYPFVRLLFLTGCRTGEAIALRWKHIAKDCSSIIFSESFDSDLNILKDTKTHKIRKFPCNPSLREFLLGHKSEDTKPEDLAFTSTNGNQINNHHFTNRVWRGGTWGNKTYHGIVTKLVEKGLVERYRPPYNTRHTFITEAIEAEMPIPQVARVVGNSAEVILRNYAGNKLSFEIPVR